MDAGLILAQMERIRAQAERETDPLLKKEHFKTIRHLHKQYRKATSHRNPWFGFLRIVIPLCVTFLLALWATAWLTKEYGSKDTLAASGITIVAFVIITVTVLVILKIVSPEIYSSVVGDSLSTLRAIAGKDTQEADAKIPEVESKSKVLLPNPPAGHHLPAPAPQISFDGEKPKLPQNHEPDSTGH